MDVDPKAGGTLAKTVLARAGADYAAAAVAGRAAGLAALYLSHADTAVELLRAAMAAARRGGERQLEGEAAMSLASALVRRGEPRRALRLTESALGQLTGTAQTRAQAQRGAILHQLGHLDEALADYSAALPALRVARDWPWVQRVHSNRAVLRIYRSELDAAAADLAEAELVCRDAGLGLQLALVHDNVGLLHLRRGDVPAALAAYDESERQHSAIGAPAGTVLLDRSELLLSVHLVREAREAAQRAVDEFTELRRYILLPQAQLLLAEAALLDGDLDTAREEAERALRRFRRQQRAEWVALASHTLLKCRVVRGLSLPSVSQVTAVAAALDRGGFAVAAAEARLSAVKLALAYGRVSQARALLGHTTAQRRRATAAVRVHGWHGEALLRIAEGRPRAAGVALRQGVRILTEHQAMLGATELRAHAAWHRNELVTAGLRLALNTGRAAPVLGWAERGRAIAALTRPVRPPEDTVLAQALTQLRAAVVQPADTRTSGVALRTEQLALERVVRDRARLHRGSAGVDIVHPSLQDLVFALGDAALVEFVEVDAQLHAVTVVAGRARLHSLGEVAEVARTVPHIPLALRRMLRDGPSRGAAQVLTALGDRLDRQLLRPLASYLGDRPLVLVPTGVLQCIPWALLPSCRGRAVTVAPSATLWHHAMNAAPAEGGVLVVAGPGLPHAVVESRLVAELHQGSELLVGERASVAAVRAGLGRARIAHLATHGVFRADNPLFSHLQFADAPLTIYDLESLPRVPSVVILAACNSGQSEILTGDELLGLAVTFLSKGTSVLIGPVVPVPDAEMASIMVDLHQGMLGGLSAAEALAAAQVRAGDGPAAYVAATGLVCFGAGGWKG